MSISKIEKIQDRILSKNISIFNINTINVPIAAIKIKNRKSICLNQNKFNTTTEKYTALLHEYYHCEADAFYNFQDSLQTMRRREYKANKQLVLDMIPINQLKKLLKANYQMWEIAEEFGVTEETINLAFKIYKNMKEI